MKKVVIFFIFFLFSNIVLSQELKVGVWHNPPLSIYDNKSGEITGFAVDIFKYIAEEKGVKYRFVQGCWNKLYEQLEKGEIDIFLPIGYSEKRLGTMDFSKYPIFTNWGELITAKGLEILNLMDLNGKKVAIQKNDLYYEGEFGLKKLLEHFNIKIDIIWVDNYLEAAEKILSKEVDAALVGKTFAFTLKDKPVSISSVNVQPVQVHFAYKKGLDIDIVKRIDNGLKELLYDKDSYYYNRLFYMYESGYRYSKMKLFLSTYYKYLIASILIIFALMFIYNRSLKREVGRKTKELRKTIDSLKMSEGELSSIIKSISSIIFIVDEDLRYIDVLTSNDDILLAPKSVVIGKRVEDFFTPQKAEFFKSHIVDVFKYKDKVTFIYDIVLKDEIRYFEATCVPLEISNSIYVVVHVNEITTYVNMTNAYKNLSMDLSVEKDKLNRILNAIQEMIIVFNMDGDIIFANHQFKKFFNLQNILSLKIYRLDNDTEISMDIDQLIRGSIGVKKVLKDCYLKVDSSRMLINGSIDIIYDSESKKSALVLILWDITRDKMIEDEMIKADKLEALGRIAAGIAHDFNNYLGGLQNYINVLSMSECEDVKSIIPSINVVLRRSRDLTKQLLTFSKGGKPIFKYNDIIPLIKRICDFSLKGSNVSLQYEFETEKICAYIDEGMFGQVISNIVINAREAMNNLGKLTVSAKLINLEEDNLYNLEKGLYARITIKDTGPGIPEHIKDKVFEPFYTTKSTGTGLGLATCYSIIQQHGGYIGFKNQDIGCEFEILVKAIGSYICEDGEIIVNDVINEDRYRFKVLYMDDEEFLRDSFGLLMGTLGADIKTVNCGEEVIDAVNKEEFDMIILDLTIREGLNGLQTMEKLKEMGVKSYFVVSSGYSSDPILQNPKAYGFNDYLPKPYGLDEVKGLLERFKIYINV